MNASLVTRLDKLEQLQSASNEMCSPNDEWFWEQFGFGPMTRSESVRVLKGVLEEISGSARSIPEKNGHG